LSEIEDVSFTIDKNGLQTYIKFKAEGRFTNGYDKTFYQLVEKKISKKNLSTLLTKKLQKLREIGITYTTEPKIKLLPEKYRDEEGDIIVEMFLIQDGQNFLKAHF
jgi:hypothetical protein